MATWVDFPVEVVLLAPLGTEPNGIPVNGYPTVTEVVPLVVLSQASIERDDYPFAYEVVTLQPLGDTQVNDGVYPFEAVIVPLNFQPLPLPLMNIAASGIQIVPFDNIIDGANLGEPAPLLGYWG